MSNSAPLDAGSPASDGSLAEGVEAEPVRPTFDALPLSEEMRATLNEIGYLHPTPVQLAVWETVTRGQDAVVQARTGTGKTAAFGLPIIERLVRRNQAAVQVLVLCPTRELAVQVSGELARLSSKKGTKIIAVYGGAPMQRQIDAIADGAQVVVGTPGRVLDHIRRGTLPTSEVRTLVLDESDEMLSMGFERELTSILETLPPTRQTVLFSATLPPDIERMAKSKLKTPEFITLSGDAIGALSIAHFVYMVTGDKAGTLGRILEVENPESAVVFCNTKDQTEVVAQALTQRGYDADWLNGDLPQNERERVMSATREGRLRFLVATDVAARGIDISHLTHVINYDFPFDAETYVHRTGRTGRAGRTGTAISLIAPQDIGGLYMLRLTYKIRPIERQIPTAGEMKTRAEADLVGMLAEAFLAKGAHPEDRALARRILAHDQAESILAGLLRDHLGARPTAQDEAAAARRATPRRGTLKRRDERWREEQARLDAEASAGRAPDGDAAEGDASRPAALEGGAAESNAPREDRPRRDRPRSDDRRPPRDDRRGDAGRGERRDRRDGPGGPPMGGPPMERGTEDRGPMPDVRWVAPPAASPHEAALPAAVAPAAVAPMAAPPVASPPEAAPPVVASGAEITAARAPAPRERRPRPEGEARGRGIRHADYATWQPPEEEGDDEPLLPKGRAAGDDPAPVRGEGRGDAGRGDAGRGDAGRGDAGRGDVGRGDVGAADGPPGAEIFVNVGRRDGIRAADLQKLLMELAGLDRERVQRVRVRDRHSFVTVPPEDLARVVEHLTGATLGGRTLNAEPARERRDDPQVAESA